MKPSGLALLLAFAFGATNANAACETRQIFKQPVVNGTAGNFCVKCNFPPGHFNIAQWEANPHLSNGEDVPSERDIGQKTGFRPAGNKAASQVAFRKSDVASGAQMAGDTVGAYINSADLSKGAPSNKFIITPSITFAPGTSAFRYPNQNGRIDVSFDLQVPVAVDEHKPLSTTYVVSDLSFTDPMTRASFYINEMVFRNRVEHPTEFVFFDGDTKMAVAFGVLSRTSRFASVGPDSTPYQTAPWKGWRHFSYSLDEAQFRAAIAAVTNKYPSIKLSDNIRDWDLKRWHLNAELLFKSGPAQMGWSMRHAAIAQTSCGGPRLQPQQ